MLEKRDICDPPRDLFDEYKLSIADQFQTHLWDITPTCQVVGVASEDNTVILDGCRAIAIRWKNFPRIEYKRSESFKKAVAEYFLRSGIAWLLLAVSTAYYWMPSIILYSPSDGISCGKPSDTSDTASTKRDTESCFNSWADDPTFQAVILAIASCLFVASLLSLFAPYSVRKLFGGSVMAATARLVAFEGTLDSEELETEIFGNFRHRLRYEPSSTPFCRYNRNLEERLGIQPNWVGRDDVKAGFPEVPNGHKLFTMVDTGRLTISIFTAEKPPTVALLCGKEGGMLRAVLCSWDFRNDCLYKEAVMRMPTEIWDLAVTKSWLKVCLESRGWFWNKLPESDDGKED